MVNVDTYADLIKWMSALPEKTSEKLGFLFDSGWFDQFLFFFCFFFFRASGR